MKTENKLYSTGGLKLLVTCLYIGSMEQLENTEKSNGIVQDEPETLMQSTEKIEILFARIRTATVDEADMFGRVLGQILRDLLPPNEILTKVIKELLIMNQSNCVCIASIIHQVCRDFAICLLSRRHISNFKCAIFHFHSHRSSALQSTHRISHYCKNS